MSDEENYEDEEVDYEEEDEEEEVVEPETAEDHGQPEKKSLRSEVSREEGETNFLKARHEAKKGELNEQLKEYINDWRKQRAREEEELKKLKEQQAARKEIRAEQDKKLAQQKKEEEDRFRKEEADKKAKEAEDKRKHLEEAEKKRQSMIQAQKDKQVAAGHIATNDGHWRSAASQQMASSVQDARREMSKTKEQLEEDKRISMSIRIKHLDVDNLGQEELLSKASELWEAIIRLETEKYDLEERRNRQDYDIRALKERQRQQLRHKAMKKGLDAEALTGKYPPKIRMYSKYERRMDTRTYDDRKKLYEGGWEVLYSEGIEREWKEKREDWAKRYRAKLPKWFGERPGRKTGDPETPEDDDEHIEEPPVNPEEVAEEVPDDVEEEEEAEEEEEEEEE